MMNEYPSLSGKTYRLAYKISEGSVGAVHALENDFDRAAIVCSGERTPEAIRAQFAKLLSMQEINVRSEFMDCRIAASPQDILLDENGAPMGYIVPFLL